MLQVFKNFDGRFRSGPTFCGLSAHNSTQLWMTIYMLINHKLAVLNSIFLFEKLRKICCFRR